MINSEKQEILEGIKQAGCRVNELSLKNCTLLRNKIEVTYAVPGTTSLWERLKKQAFFHDTDGCIEIANWVGNRSVILFFDLCEDASMFDFKDGKDLLNVFNHSFVSEFYLSDEQATFFFCLNHHDFIIGAGTAYSWIVSLKDNIQDKADVDYGEIKNGSIVTRVTRVGRHS